MMASLPQPDARGERLEALRGRLAALRGLGEAYYDHRGELRWFSSATRAALLAAMGCDPDDPAALEAAIDGLGAERWRAMLPPVAVLRPGRMGVALALPADALEGDIA